jgi:hypothetical protein
MRKRIFKILAGSCTLAAMVVTGFLTLAPRPAVAVDWDFYPGYYNHMLSYCYCPAASAGCLCGFVRP